MIKFNDKSFQILTDESLLECLLRHGEFIPNGCRSGVCRSCIMQAINGNPGADAQKGLKTTQIEKNHFFACLCHPQNDIEVEFPGATVYRAQAKVISIEPFNHNVYRLRLERPTDFHYRAGQYLTLYNDRGDGRNYSLASVPEVDNNLELHIRYLPSGKVSGWICRHLHAGDVVTIGEPLGDCVYNEKDSNRPLLLIGTGSGAAPLFGVLRQALNQNHSGQIVFYQGSSSMDGLYLHQSLQKLAETNTNFTYKPSISRYKQDYSRADISEGRASDLAIQENKDLRGWQVYVCGNPDMVNTVSRTVFLKGASLSDIHADPFVHPKTS